MVEFRSRALPRRPPGPRNDDSARRGIEGPFVNSPNAWLRLRLPPVARARISPGVFFMILLD